MSETEPMNSTPAAWNTRYVQRGTPWPDEPSECIDPGWYVIGHDPTAGHVDETDIVSTARIRVEHAIDGDGNVISGLLARQIAEAMTQRSAAQRMEPLGA